MSTALVHVWYMTLRDLRMLWRQPWYVVITLVQPLIWLLLFGALFRSVTEIPGFGGGSYIQFLTPGVVVMTGLFSAGWSGMATIEDIDRGVTDRFLVSPIRRSALIAGRVFRGAVVIVVQAAVILALALAVGARFPNGVLGVSVLVAVAAVLGASFGAVSNGLALLARKEETLIAVMNLLLLPLTFLSSAFMRKELMPGWMRRVAAYNPVDWAVDAGRAAAMQQTDWGLVASRAGLLLVLLVACAAFATRAFRVYQRSV